MRLIHTEISRLTNELLSIELIEDPSLQCPFHSQPEYHSHPEVELLYVIEGTGTRIVNGKAERFRSGDMVFMGPGVPHIWMTDDNEQITKDRMPKAILLYFNINKFQELFNTVKEFQAIKKLVSDGKKGIKIFGQTREVVARMLNGLYRTEGYPQIEGILRILHLLSISTDTEYIINHFNEPEDQEVSDRLVPVLKYVNENLQSAITLRQVADIACMTENAFCRFFRNRLKKSFSQYIQEQRMTKACALLVQTDKPISDISDLCGYKSTSHFSQVFKTRIRLTPFQYRRSVERD